MSSNKPRTTIRIGASHNELTIEGLREGPFVLPLAKAKWKEKGEVAAHLCELHQIEGPKPKRKRHKRKGDKRHVSTDRTTGQVHTGQAAGGAEAQDAAKVKGRKRRKPRTVPTSGPNP